jgi:hypothetical protein
MKMIIEVAGYPEDTLEIDTNRVECGIIKNGVSFSHGSKGGWVVNWDDFEQVYLTLKHTQKAKP